MTSNNLTKTILERGVVEIIDKEHLTKCVDAGKKLRVKFGIDPTAPDLHLGHTVPLRKLRQFQDAGHQIVLIIGDFTARIGDPSGRTKGRVPLTEKEIKVNLKNYLKQAGKILNVKKAEIYYNRNWFKKEELLLEIMGVVSMSRSMERDDFQKRIKSGGDVSLLEALYSGLQGYDSVAVKADVEIGGTDQKFNLLMGRRLQRHFGASEQDIITLPLLEGTDGIEKMSKSVGNYIGLNETPEVMFAKAMSIPDTLIMKYTELLTDLSLITIAEEAKVDPRGAKMKLAREIVRLYHNEKMAQKAEEEFIKVVSNKGIPSTIESLDLSSKSLSLVDLLMATKLVSSKSEARRLIEQGGVKIDGVKKTNPLEIIDFEGEIILQIGKRHFLKLLS